MFLFYFGSQIDDKEFDIPQVDTPPTLESILNEVKYMLLFDYYIVMYGITQFQQYNEYNSITYIW